MLKALLCPECGRAMVLSREECLVRLGRKHRKSSNLAPKADYSEPLLCASCGRNLQGVLEDAIEPLPCARSQIVCGYPCGAREKPSLPGESKCQNMVPMGRI